MSADAGTWVGGPSRFRYAWRRCNARGRECTPIADASGAAYTVTAGDLGHTLRVSVTAANTVSSASAVSPASAVVASSTSA